MNGREKMYAALQVISLNPKISEFLTKNDPKALEQVRSAVAAAAIEDASIQATASAPTVEKTAQDFIARLPDPDSMSQAEYRTIYDHLASTVEDATVRGDQSAEDTFDWVATVLEELKITAASMERALNNYKIGAEDCWIKK